MKTLSNKTMVQIKMQKMAITYAKVDWVMGHPYMYISFKFLEVILDLEGEEKKVYRA